MNRTKRHGNLLWRVQYVVKYWRAVDPAIANADIWNAYEFYYSVATTRLFASALYDARSSDVHDLLKEKQPRYKHQ